MKLGNDCEKDSAGCRTGKIKLPFKNKFSSLFLAGLFIFSFVLSSSVAVADRTPVQKPYDGPNVVNEFFPMGTTANDGPKLKVNGITQNPIADEDEDLTIDLCTGTKTWELLKEYTPWGDVNRFGFYTDLGTGNLQTLVFSGPDDEGETTTTTTTGTVGLWLLNDTDGNLVYSGNDSYLFSERSLTYGSGADDHQWFMVYDVSAYKGTGATYTFITPTEDFTTTGDFDYLIYIDDDHTSSNFDHNDMILGMTCPEEPECDSVKIANHFTAEFQGVTYDSSASTSTWCYTLMWDGTPPGLSHFTIELCTLITNGNLVSADPSYGSIGPDGSTGLYGIKWDDIENFPSDTAIMFCFTLDQMLPIAETEFAPKAGVNSNIETICGPALDCDDPCISNSPPIAYCPGDTAMEVCDLSEICLTGFGASDVDGNISSITVTGGTLSGDTVCFNPVEGSNVIQLIVTDYCGEADTCETIITITTDTIPPTLVSCPGDLTVQCDAVPSPPPGLTGTDNCDPNPVVTYLGETTTPGACPQAFSITRSWEVSDAAGNADTCTQTITVEDTAPPSFVDCPADVTVECDAVPAPGTPTAVDNCDSNVTVTYLGESSSAGACPNSYTLTRTWLAEDACGNSDTCVQTITVEDNTAPVLSGCPADVTVECDNIPTVGSPTATDNCDPNPTVNYLGEVSTPGACPNSYTLTRSWEAVDACGNADTCVQTIEVVDTTAPTLVDCPADITVECDAVPTPATVSATDNCSDAANITIVFSETTTAGSCPQSYTLTRRWIATDECGNADTCYQDIDVVDTTAPTFVDCPNDTTVACDAIPSPATPSASDNCDASPTVTYLGEVINPGNCPYTITRSWEAIDACGNADTCTQTITVIDTESPSFVDCPADVTVECDAIPVPASPTATDNCDANPTITYLGESTTAGACPNSYTLTRSWEATDVCGNADTCVQTITVEDTTAPVLSGCPADVTAECDNIPAVGNPTATDNCDPNPTVNYLGEVSTPGACPNSYTLTRSWEAIDACGNADTCSQNIDVVDTTPPSIVDCPADATVECDAVPSPATVSATDNCSDAAGITIVFSETTAAGSCPQSYTLTRTWIATDECGNADTCSQVIDVVDTTAPVLADCPADVTADCDNIPGVGSPTATDNCDPNPVVNYLGEVSTPGACPNSFTLTRSWEAVDACGNADTCSQTIDVVDNAAPSFVDCPNDSTVQCDAIPAPANPSATDNCDSSPTVNYLGETVNPGNCPYTIVRSWEAIDACGNADTCVQTLTVIDSEAPSFVDCPADENASCDNVPAPASPTATDNCDQNPTVTYLGEVSTPGACANSYTLTRSWEATDICGNADTCVQTITVEDTTKPTCSVPNDTTIYLCDTATICFPVGANDNCDSLATCSQIAGGGTYSNGTWCYQAMAGTEDVQAIFECTDDCGNVCIDTINVHFVVNTAPQISVNVNPAVLCDAGDTVCVPFNVVDPDNGTSVQTQLGWISGNSACFTADTSGSYCNALIVTDSCGLSDTVSYCVDVTVCPTPDLGADSTKDFGFVCSPISDSFRVRAIDPAGNCGSLTWTVNGTIANPDTTIQYSVGACTDFDQTWVITVSDDCGRSDTMNVTIRAQVNCRPEASCPGFLQEIRVCSLGTVVCIPGDEFTCDDDDNNEASATLNGQPYNPGDSYCFTATAAGPKTLTFICTDECGAADTCVATVDVIVDQDACATGCTAIRIEKVHNTIQGQYETVEVVIDSMPIGLGGFDLLIEYDPSALSLSNVIPGSFITSCGWEYFTYRNGASGNCASSACPSGKVRLIAVAETNNGMNHPTCFQAQPAQLAELIFLVTNDRNFECQYVPIRFCWYDCGDNTVSGINGDSLYISSRVFDYYDGILWTEITNLAAPFPTRAGANATCDIDIGDGKPDPIRCIDFYNGGIDIICADSIDARGDINLNEIPNEVSDAVLLSNYFIYGLAVFTVNVEGQIAASDVNADGNVLSVADLVYLIRIVIGDAAPYSKATIPVDVRMSQTSDGVLTIEDQTQIGAAFIVAHGQVSPALLVDNMEMETNFDGVTTRILVWSRIGNNFTGDFIQINSELVSIEMATSEGNPVMLNALPSDFVLNQNYPNPFNPTTTISFTLPVASNYELSIFNISGQNVANFVGSAEAAGTVELQWEAGDYASGIYFYKLTAGEFTEIKKMMLIK